MTAPKKTKDDKPVLPKKGQLTEPYDVVVPKEAGYNVKVKYGDFVEVPVDEHGIELGDYIRELDRKGLIYPKKKGKK